MNYSYKLKHLATILRETGAFKESVSLYNKKIFSVPLYHHHQPEPLIQDKYVFTLSCGLCQIMALPSEYRSRNRESSDQAMFFIPIFYCPIFVIRSELESQFLFLSDIGDTGLLLL